ncbi:hypothetical protein [Sulfurimonas marina]|uniref:Uncharacterized protein n=1 Tax=Sulfurimonas marina TaxID=2590551 RepID=A0A7M1AZH3_9BACT|nr:hypothetical protein [Sulfurimonas marina]QOP41772.1 hypothetical protein FJR03_08480 [Sulfurimonas marina]
MLSIKNRIYMHFFIIVSAIFIIIGLILKYTLVDTELPKDFWFSYFELVFILYVVSYYILKKFVFKLDKDINALIKYLEELNDKNYDAHLEIHHNLEFLKISLLLKNLVKRLYKKK